MRLAEMRAALGRDRPAVLVLVAEAEGSTPREAGAAMLVGAGGAAGTIGGGVVEARAIEIAREMLATDAERRVERFLLGPEIDQCCGGALALAFRLLAPGAAPSAPFALWEGGPVFEEPRRRAVHLYGAGHVGQAIAAALAPLDVALVWVDPRAGAFDGIATMAETIVTPLPEAIAERAPEDAFHLVLTHSHAVDLEIVAAILSREFGFCGLIGSETKRALFARRLRERAVPESAIARLTCPIGALAIKDKRPAVIAASVAAQLLLLEAAR